MTNQYLDTVLDVLDAVRKHESHIPNAIRADLKNHTLGGIIRHDLTDEYYINYNILSNGLISISLVKSDGETIATIAM